MRQDCSTCPAQKQCWASFTELNMLACRVRFGANVESILRVLLPELKSIIRMTIEKRRVHSTTPEDLYALIYEALRTFDPSYEISPLTRLFSKYNGIVVNELRASLKRAKNHVSVDQIEDMPAPEPPPLPDLQQEAVIEAAIMRMHDGKTLTSREFRVLFAWLYATVPVSQLAVDMSIKRQDGHLLVMSALRKIQKQASIKERYARELTEGTVEEAAARLGKKPAEIKAARARLERGAKPRARAGTALAVEQAKIDIFRGKASDVAKALGCQVRRVYAMRAEQRKAHAARAHRRSP